MKNMPIEDYLKAIEGTESFEELAIDRLWQWHADFLSSWGENAGDPPATLSDAIDAVYASVEKIQADRVAESAAVPALENLASRLGVGNAVALGELDDAAPEKGAYVSDDSKKIVIVQGCAMSPNDPDNVASAAFPIQGEDGIRALATIDVPVMTDGTLNVWGQVDGFVQDSDSNWVAK